MPVGVLQIEVFLPKSASLKDRRQSVRSVKDQLRHRFNVSVAELGDTEHWQRATIGICAIANDGAYLDGLLRKAAEAAAGWLAGQEVQIGPIEIVE